MKLVDREIQLMNNIIDATLEFGGGLRGPYLTEKNKPKFVRSVNSWLKNRGLADTYEIVEGDPEDDWWYRIQSKDLSRYKLSIKSSDDDDTIHLKREQREASELGLSLTDYYLYCRLRNRFVVLLELMNKSSLDYEDRWEAVDSFIEAKEEYHNFLRDHNLVDKVCAKEEI